jgi:hypothetical protein
MATEKQHSGNWKDLCCFHPGDSQGNPMYLNSIHSETPAQTQGYGSGQGLSDRPRLISQSMLRTVVLWPSVLALLRAWSHHDWNRSHVTGQKHFRLLPAKVPNIDNSRPQMGTWELNYYIIKNIYIMCDKYIYNTNY